jgi:hypothetical protein
MSNQTYDLPSNLGDLMGAYDEAHWQTAVLELTPDAGVLTRGTVLSMGGTGKLDATTAGNESQAYGVLLDPSIDTAAAAAFSNGQVTGSVAKSGSFRGAALIVGVGANVVTLTDALRKNDIFVEGPISPGATTLAEENNA